MPKAGASTFSLSGNNRQHGANSTAASGSSIPGTPAAQKRTNHYTLENLHSAWLAYMKANPTCHILVNTMRASYPAHVEGHTYRVMIENEKQREELDAHMQSLLAFLRDTLSNDDITLTVELNQGESSPHTWNERQVLQHMIESNPDMRDLIDSLQLSIG